MAAVTRFAPSPTGPLHIGGARTALFSWAFARHEGGRFVLRFEDTDRARSSLESEGAILEALDWLGLDHDPVQGTAGVPRQSERGSRYAATVERLIDSGHGYRCVCAPEQVEAMRERARSQGRADSACRRRAG